MIRLTSFSDSDVTVWIAARHIISVSSVNEKTMIRTSDGEVQVVSEDADRVIQSISNLTAQS